VRENKISYLEFIKYHHQIPLINLSSLFDQIAIDGVDLGEGIKL